ncbi:hypothetical protein ACFE04_028036 [Oxalis oulophora]
MECNKEEAINAKKIAEKKLAQGDYQGAQKIARKAQQLNPSLEYISHLLAICDVHCAAEIKLLGSEMNLYDILQVEQFADETIIKKQYRKLALLLHPDKNNIVGAEAAFKLVGQANGVLTDQTKRSSYDMKFKTAVTSTRKKPAPRRQSKGGSSVVRPSGNVPNAPPSNVPNANAPQSNVSNANAPQSNVPNANAPQSNVPNANAPQSNVPKANAPQSDVPKANAPQAGVKKCPKKQTTFWTCCQHCTAKYQYFVVFMNVRLHCQNCHQYFIGHDLDATKGSEKQTSSQIPSQNGTPDQEPPSTNESKSKKKNFTEESVRNPPAKKSKTVDSKREILKEAISKLQKESARDPALSKGGKAKAAKSKLAEESVTKKSRKVNNRDKNVKAARSKVAEEPAGNSQSKKTRVVNSKGKNLKPVMSDFISFLELVFLPKVFKL